MSEISANGATETVYIQNNGGTIQYRINLGTWTSLTFPCTVSNTNATPGANVLKILFTSNLTLSSTNDYFICGTNGIQFGSSMLNSDGSRPSITVPDLYDGLIQNGTATITGKSNIYVYNLIVDGTGNSTQNGAGWFGKTFFGKGATDNYFVNCASLGDINGGGIVGALAANSSGSVILLRCSSSGIIGDNAGGIVGPSSTGVQCEQCWSERAINGVSAGGIFGIGCENCTVISCYSTGDINGINAGGIMGDSCTLGTVINCYSTGNIIGLNTGGLFGANATNPTIIQCYTIGHINDTITGSENSRSFYGTGVIDVPTVESSYGGNGQWSTVTAKSKGITGPSSDPGWSTIWVSATGLADTPYELASFGYTPYIRQNIAATYPPSLVQTYSATVQAGASTTPAVKTSAFSLIPGSTAYPAITINSTTGAITASAATAPGTYTLYVRNTGSYNNTTFTLTVTAAPSADSNGCCPTPVQLQDLDNTTLTQVKRGVIIGIGPRNPSTFASYNDYITYKLTKSFLRQPS